ncbi:hypothetical protein [Paraburkholderia xenovorans]|uniref:hypothetical protein n=1 Tax=Paraburkholderia xenovorans TaxID=36873 RepID=UPI0038BC607A
MYALRLAGLDTLKNDAALDGSVPERITDIFQPVVAADLRRLAALRDCLIWGPDNAQRRQREVHINAHAFQVEVVDHVE